jgi:hypothetical protein
MTDLRLSADEADFALIIHEAFGEARFTLSDYFARIERGKRQRLPEPDQNQRMREKLEAHTRVSVGVLLSAPGPRGGVGWKLNPDAVPALRRRESVVNARAARKQREFDAWAARRSEIENKPRKLRDALGDRFRDAGLADPVVEEFLAAVDAIVAADRRARRGSPW